MFTSMKEDHDLNAAMTYRQFVEDWPAIEKARQARRAEKAESAAAEARRANTPNSRKRIRKKTSTRPITPKR
jgi:hypothetical protein